MTLSSKHSIYAMAATLTSLLLLGITLADAAQADLRTQAIVTVYSDGKLMTTYEAIDRGRMEEGCYVFKTRKGVRDVEVRVCGTFTVEQLH